jgi:hypothetical protein
MFLPGIVLRRIPVVQHSVPIVILITLVILSISEESRCPIRLPQAEFAPHISGVTAQLEETSPETIAYPGALTAKSQCLCVPEHSGC